MSDRASGGVQTSLVGRGDEVALVTRLLGDVWANGLRMLIVEGVGGVGKSRFLAEMVEIARRRPTVVVSARASGPGRAPFSAVYPLLRAVFGQAGGHTVVEELSHSRPGSSGLRLTNDANVDRNRRMFDAATATADALVALGGEDALVLVLADDVQWFDTSSQEFLALVIDDLTDRLSHCRVLLVAASRPVPGQAGQLARVLRASARARQVFLGPLSELEEADLVRSQVPDAGVPYLDLVRRSSRGIPLQSLAAVSVLRRRVVPGDVTASDQRVVRAAALALPSPLGDADGPLRSQLAQLSATAAGVLAHAAVFGTEFSLADAVAVSGGGDGAVAASLDEATRAGVLETDGVTFWFAHDRLAEVALDGLAPTARLAVHRRCAERLAAQQAAGVSGLEVEIGRHQLLVVAGNEVADGQARALADAGNVCYAAGAWEDASHFFEQALSLGVYDDGERLQLVLRAGMAHYYRQDVPSAETRLLEAVSLAKVRAEEEPWCTAVITLARMRNTLHRRPLQNPPDVSPLTDFLAQVTDPRLRAEALVPLAEVQVTQGQLQSAHEATRDAIRSAEDGGSDALQAMASFAEGFALMAGNRLAEAERPLRRALQLGAAAGDWYIEANLRLRLAFSLVGRGALSEATALTRDALAVSKSRSDHLLGALGWSISAQLALIRGDFDEVDRAAERAAAATRRSGYGLAASFYLSAQFLARLHTERFDEAHALIAAGQAMWPLASRLAPLVDAARGDVPPIDTNRRPPTARNQLQAAAVAAATELGLAQQDTDTLAALAPQLAQLERQGVLFCDLYPVFVPRLRADALRALGELDEAAAEFGRAAELARVIGAVPEEAFCSLGRASLEMVRPAAEAADARAWAVRGGRIAQRINLPRCSRQADALARVGIDLPASVDARGGTWRVVLVTDVVGSSRVSAEVGDVAYWRLIMHHHELVRRCLERHGGHEFSESGDGLLAWFASTADAVSAAFAILDELEIARSSGPELRVKVGLAGGEPLFHDGRPYGQVVNRAARVVDLAVGGQVLCDEAVTESLPPGVLGVIGTPTELRNLGTHRLATLRRASGAGSAAS